MLICFCRETPKSGRHSRHLTVPPCCRTERPYSGNAAEIAALRTCAPSGPSLKDRSPSARVSLDQIAPGSRRGPQQGAWAFFGGVVKRLVEDKSQAGRGRRRSLRAGDRPSVPGVRAVPRLRRGPHYRPPRDGQYQRWRIASRFPLKLHDRSARFALSLNPVGWYPGRRLAGAMSSALLLVVYDPHARVDQARTK